MATQLLMGCPRLCSTEVSEARQRATHSESLQQRNQVPEQLEGRPRASSVAAPNWYSFVVMKVQAWEGNNPRLVLEESL